MAKRVSYAEKIAEVCGTIRSRLLKGDDVSKLSINEKLLRILALSKSGTKVIPVSEEQLCWWKNAKCANSIGTINQGAHTLSGEFDANGFPIGLCLYKMPHKDYNNPAKRGFLYFEKGSKGVPYPVYYEEESFTPVIFLNTQLISREDLGELWVLKLRTDEVEAKPDGTLSESDSTLESLN